MDHDYALSLLLMFPVSQAVPRLEGLKAHRIKNYSRAIVRMVGRPKGADLIRVSRREWSR